MGLSGTHHVRASKSALVKARRKLVPAVKPRAELRRQTLKLKHWGLRHQNSGVSEVMDLSYESIKAMAHSDVYELRIDGEIGGQRNIRVIFFVPPGDWVPIVPSPLPYLWVLEAVAKRRDWWSQGDIDRFWALRDVVKERIYE